MPDKSFWDDAWEEIKKLTNRENREVITTATQVKTAQEWWDYLSARAPLLPIGSGYLLSIVKQILEHLAQREQEVMYWRSQREQEVMYPSILSVRVSGDPISIPKPNFVPPMSSQEQEQPKKKRIIKFED